MSRARAVAEKRPDPAQHRILLVEDNPGDADLVQEYLDEAGGSRVDVLVTETLALALHLLEEESFTAVLLDLSLPDSTGLETLERVLEHARATPVVVLTGGGGDELGVEAVRRGASDFLPKGELAGKLLIRSLRYAVERSRRFSAEARYRALVENSRDVVFVFDEYLCLTYASPSVRTVLGYEPERKLGADAVLEAHPEDRARVADALRRTTVESGYTTHLRFRVSHKDGGWRILDTVIQNCLDVPGIEGLVVNAWDVTSLHEAEEESQRSAEQVRLQARMLEAVGQAVIATDRDGTITYWNHAAEELYGWSRDETLGQPVLTVMPTAPRRDQAGVVFGALSRGETWTGEFELHRRDGSTFVGLVTEAPVFDEQGDLVGVIGISSDLTERRDLEERLRQSQKMEAIGRLAGGIAHDFNNLLTAIQGYLQLLLEDASGDAPLISDLRQVLAASERAAELTHQLLAFSRRQVLRERRIDLGATVKELEPMLRRLIPERIDVHVDVASEEIIARADRGQLNQVVMNLVVNAVDAIANQGKITLAVDSLMLPSNGLADVAWKVVPGMYARIAVEDSGTGIEPEVLEHIFEPFFTTKAEGRGTGLGLAPVYGIVKQSGGHILVRSEPGGGTRFEAFLPLAPGPADQVPAPSTPRAKEAPGGVILLVEDHEAVRHVAQRILQRAGYSVLEAVDGSEALDVVERSEEPIDLVLTDLVMPGLGGIELRRRLAERRAGLKVVLMSGYSDAELREEMEHPDSIVLTKPFTPDELTRRVAEALATQSA